MAKTKTVSCLTGPILTLAVLLAVAESRGPQQVSTTAPCYVTVTGKKLNRALTLKLKERYLHRIVRLITFTQNGKWEVSHHTCQIKEFKL